MNLKTARELDKVIGKILTGVKMPIVDKRIDDLNLTFTKEIYLKKLRNDGYLEDVIFYNEKRYSLTIEGLSLKERGGYKWKTIRERFNGWAKVGGAIIISVCSFISVCQSCEANRISNKQTELMFLEKRDEIKSSITKPEMQKKKYTQACTNTSSYPQPRATQTTQ